MTSGRILGGVVAPVVVIAGWLAYLATAFAGGTDIVFKVEGYDPRDILRGHYLEYRILYDLPIPGLEVGRQAREACVCVEPGADGFGRGTWFGDCNERDPVACPHALKGRVDHRGFTAGIERFYFPEEHRVHLGTVPPGATARVRIARNGVGFVQDIRIGDESIVDYARRQAVAARSTPAQSE